MEERPLFDAKTGQEVGTIAVHGTLMRVDGGELLVAFTGSNKLKDGVIEVQGTFGLSDFGPGFTSAIVGGTGAFARARGTVNTKDVDTDTAQFTFDVLP